MSAAGTLSRPHKQARHSAVTASPPEGHGHGGAVVPVRRDLLGAGKPAPRRGSVGGFLGQEPSAGQQSPVVTSQPPELQRAGPEFY